MRRRGGSTGEAARRAARSSIARHRTRGPNTPWPGDAGPGAVGRGRAACGSAGPGRCGGSALSAAARRDPTGVRWRTDRRPASGSPARRASSSTQQQRRPSSSQVPSTISPPGASRARIVDHASATASSRVLAQHVERAHQNRAQPGQFETAERELDGRRCGVAGARPAPDRSPGRPPARRCAPCAAGSPAPAWSPAARRSRGRPPADRRRTAARCAPAASAPASGRCGAAGWRRWCPRVGTPTGRLRPSDGWRSSRR